MLNQLKPGELSEYKAEHDIDENLNRFANSIDELAAKLDRPVQKVQSVKRTIHKIQESPWGVVAVGSAFFIGFMIMRNKR